MLEPGTTFRVRTEEIAAKVMERDAILVNLANGMYYSLLGVGGLVWILVEGGHSGPEHAWRSCAATTTWRPSGRPRRTGADGSPSFRETRGDGFRTRGRAVAPAGSTGDQGRLRGTRPERPRRHG